MAKTKKTEIVKSKGGRKKLDKSLLKTRITLFIKNSTIDKYGDVDILKNKVYEFLGENE